MADDKLDVIVVGAGPAGSVAAYRLAQEGLQVGLIERGEFPGSKNLSGGVLYSRVLSDLMPEFWEQAPVERYVTSYLTTFMNASGGFTVDYKTTDFGTPPYNAFTVLRSKFDRWLAEQAEEAGAMLMAGVRVDNLVKEEGRVVGVQAGDETLNADIVILADGANSFLAQKAGMARRIQPKHIAVGVKSLIELPRQTIEDRFRLTGDEGTAYAIVGDVTHGVGGGGFIYTNSESISIGIVMRLDDLLKTGLHSSKVHDDFLAHPLIAPLVRDGRLLEYGAHLVPEGGLDMLPQLIGDGVLVVGDAAGLTVNNGLVVRGMDLAIGSGLCAARAALDAKKANDFSSQGLASYRRYLDSSFVMADLKTYARAPHFMENHRIYTKYPDLVVNMMRDVYTHDAKPKQHIVSTVMQAVKQSGVSMGQLALDGLNGVRAI